MKKFWKLFLPISAFLLLVAACSEETANTHSDSERLNVVTSIFPMYEITKEVAGDRADVFIYASENMEAWVDSLLDVVENEDVESVEFSKGLDLELEESNHSEALEDLEDVEEHGHEHDDVDPHFWLNPLNVKNQLPLVVNALTAADPEGAEIYTENAQRFSQALTELDQTYT